MNQTKDTLDILESVPPKATPKEWWGLAVLALPCILYAMDFTVLQLAVPHLLKDLGSSNNALLWIMDIYGFVLAGFLITMGILGDKIGRRKLLLIGATLFGIASLFAAFSTSSTELIIARAILGLAAATLAPSTLSLIRNMFHDEKQRGIAIGVWITSFSVGSAIGPLVGGSLLTHFWWGSVFLVAVPVMALLLILGPKLLPEFKDKTAGRPDLLSATLTLLTILPVIYALKTIATHGLDIISVFAIAASVGFGYWFVRRQETLSHPFVDLSLFRSKVFSALIFIYVVVFFIMFASFYFISKYLQLVRGMDALEAGLWTLPWALSFVVGSMLGPLLTQKFSTYKILAVGLLISSIGLAILVPLSTGTPLGMYVLGFSMLALGFGPVLSLITDSIIATVPPKRAGMASGISETASELGGALGIALLGSLAAFIYTSSIEHAYIQIPGDTLGATLQAAGSLTASAAQEATLLAKEAYTSSLHWIFAVSTGLSLGASVLAYIIYQRKRKLS